MGTHPSNPSTDLTTSRTLLDMLQDNQALLSTSVAKKYNSKLPFLFKVLSINKALSIQAHPNKKLAEQIHARDSKNYPDDNHKPEMTIAITPFDGLCGFRPLAEIRHFLDNIKALRELVGEQECKKFEDAVKEKEESEDKSVMEANKKALREAFTALMTSKAEDVERLAPKLIQQAKDEGSNFAGDGGPSNDGQELADLMVRLDGQFPNDIGLFVTFFLNYVKLEVGEAMFLKADDIHAYLSGGTPPHVTLPHITPPTNSLGFRHNRMHGLLRQRRPRRLHPQIQRRPHANLHAHLLLRPHLRTKDVPRRLPLRQTQQHGLQILVFMYTVRPTDRRVLGRAN
jgi:mannose-6-phosphate isomerase